MATCWGVVTRALHELGGEATAIQVEQRIDFAFEARSGLDRAKHHGLVACAGRGREPRWWLTQRGIDWCENRLCTTEQRNLPQRGEKPQFVGLRFVPTWLAALPRNLRLAPSPPSD